MTRLFAHLSLQWKLLTVAAAVLAVSVTIGAVTYVTTGSNAESIEWVDHTREVIATADSVLRENPNDVEAVIQSARLRRHDFRYREAVDLYRRAIALAPDDWRGHRFLGHRHISLRQFEDAVPPLERARQLAPSSFDVAYHLGLAYFLNGRFDEAADEYLRCMRYAERAGEDGGNEPFRGALRPH